MVGILVSFWDGPVSGAMLVLGSVYQRNIPMKQVDLKVDGYTVVPVTHVFSAIYRAYKTPVLTIVGAHFCSEANRKQSSI